MRSIIISGMPSCGKSTVAAIVAKELGFKMVNGGDVLKEIAKENGYTVSGEDWWDTEQGMKFLKQRAGDPKFDKDREYPNVWQAVDKDAVGNVVLGPKHLYSGSGFYVKATRLKAPENAIFFEFHSAYNEPTGWFDGGKDLRMKLPSIIKFQVEEFRGKFGRASRR